jgi:hypothetical protein
VNDQSPAEDEFENHGFPANLNCEGWMLNLLGDIEMQRCGRRNRGILLQWNK